MKNNFSKIKKSEKSVIFVYFTYLKWQALIKESPILVLHCRCHFGWKICRKSSFTSIYSWKGEKYYNSLSVFFDVTPEVESFLLLKVKLQCGSEAKSIKISYFITLKSIGIACILNTFFLPMNNFVISCIGNLKIKVCWIIHIF